MFWYAKHFDEFESALEKGAFRKAVRLLREHDLKLGMASLAGASGGGLAKPIERCISRLLPAKPSTVTELLTVLRDESDIILYVEQQRAGFGSNVSPISALTGTLAGHGDTETWYERLAEIGLDGDDPNVRADLALCRATSYLDWWAARKRTAPAALEQGQQRKNTVIAEYRRLCEADRLADTVRDALAKGHFKKALEGMRKLSPNELPWVNTGGLNAKTGEPSGAVWERIGAGFTRLGHKAEVAFRYVPRMVEYLSAHGVTLDDFGQGVRAEHAMKEFLRGCCGMTVTGRNVLTLFEGAKLRENAARLHDVLKELYADETDKACVQQVLVEQMRAITATTAASDVSTRRVARQRPRL